MYTLSDNITEKYSANKDKSLPRELQAQHILGNSKLVRHFLRLMSGASENLITVWKTKREMYYTCRGIIKLETSATTLH